MNLRNTLLSCGFLLSSICAYAGTPGTGAIEEPYPQLTGKPTGARQPYSPDPLVRYRWDSPAADDDLEVYTLKPLSVKADKPEAISRSDPGKRITVSGDCDLMFDFGQVNAGWLEFDCESLPADVTCSISEFNEPARFNAGSEHPDKTAAPVRYGDTYRLELNKQLYEGVRYAWIHLKGVSGKIVLKNVRLVCQTKPVNYEGSFACNDTTLNRVWYTAAYTVRLNLLKDYFGAILMERSDRHSWTGDAHTSQAAALVAFGNYDFVRKNLLYTSEQYNGIESYSLYWVQSLIDYFTYTGDTATALALTDNACGKLDRAYGFFDHLPSLSFYGWDERLGGGFEQPNLPETQLAYRALAIQTWRRFACMMEACGRQELAERYRRYAEEKTGRLRCLPEWYREYDIFALSDAVNAGVVRPEEEEAIWQTAFADRIQRVSYSPFNQYFVLNAMARMNRYAEALNTIDDCWGGQLRYGATTFFEVFRPSWNLCKRAQNDAPVNNQCGYTSFTHPWSSGVLKWLTEEVLGVRPTRPGFAEFSVRPHLTNGLTRVKGDVPTPRGTVSFEIDTREGKARLTVPEQSVANVAIPLMGTRGITVSVDGKAVSPTHTDEAYAYLPPLGTGKHELTLRYEGTPESPVKREEIAYRYGTETVTEDGTTGGAWKGRYGKLGYVLFSYDEAGAHRMKLPDGCRSVILQKGISWHDDSLSDSPAALTDPVNPSRKQMGGAITGDPMACWQTFTIDVDYRVGKPYKLSVYLADPTGNRRSAIELFDLDTKRLLTPVRMVRDYSGGRYVTFTVDRPVRIRVCQVRGDNAVCPGIFFDES